MEIPEVLTEFIYDRKTIPVCVEELYKGRLIGQGAFGKVYAVVTKGLPNNLMAAKVCSLDILIIHAICLFSASHVQNMPK